MEFMRHLMAGLLVTLLWYCAQSPAQSVEGRYYSLVKPAQPMSPDKVEVTEYFSYQCPHCAAFAPSLEAWSKRLPADVVFKREAVWIGHEAWQPAAKTYYALQVMGKLAALDAAIFKAIHQQRQNFADPAVIESWIASQKIAAADFRTAYKSFSVDTKVKRADAVARNYKIPAVPTMVVDGKYLVPISSDVDYQQQFTNLEALIARARAEKKAAGARK
jgi:protein dithiol oxidoreductase (disulfide-forming)